MNTPTPFKVPQTPFGNGPTPSGPVAKTAISPEKQEAIKHFKKVRQDLNNRSLKEIIVDAATSVGPVQIVLSGKTTQIRLTGTSPTTIFACNMETAECSLNGKDASQDDIQKFQKVSDEVQKLTEQGKTKIKNVPRDL